MKQKLMLIGLLLINSGCATMGGQEATSEKYDEYQKTWLGHTMRELIQIRGIPDNVLDMANQEKAYTYIYNGGNAGMALGPNVLYIPISCKTTFFADKTDTIFSYRFQGNACRST